MSDAPIQDAVGAGFAAKIFGGYDWWIGPQWSLGLAAVLAATPSTSLVDHDGDATGYPLLQLVRRPGGEPSAPLDSPVLFGRLLSQGWQGPYDHGAA